MLRSIAHNTYSTVVCCYYMCQVEHPHFNIFIKNTLAYIASLA